MQLEAIEKKPLRILVIAAHPDDIEFGMAGSAALWVEAGAQITYCLVTDGVTEAWGSNGDPYGQERLEVLLAAPGDRAPRALVDRVRGDVAAFQGGASPTDDLTILALGYEG